MTRLLGVLVLVSAVAACAKSDAVDPSAGSSGTVETTSADSGEDTALEPSVGAVDCWDLDWDVVVSTCEQATDELGCQVAGTQVEGLAQTPGNGPCYGCAWLDWVPTTIDDQGSCSYSEVVASCVPDSYANDIGCLEAPGPCSNGQGMYYREGPGGIEIVVASMCSLTPGEECFASLGATGPFAPECACGCDPAFPGI